MLILPPGHAESIRAGRRLSVREKRLLGAVLAATGALLLVVVIALSSSGRSSAHGCLYVTIPAATGAQEISECGSTARATCASARTPGAFTQQAAAEIASECRKAGLPVG
ncbi:MAG: hypothetical protein ABSG43_08145 [Solirubrobacteraceae bacterium]